MIAIFVLLVALVFGTLAPALWRRSVTGLVAALALGLYFDGSSVFALVAAGVALASAVHAQPSRLFTYVALAVLVVFALSGESPIVGSTAEALFCLLSAFAGGWVLASVPEPQTRRELAVSVTLALVASLVVAAQFVSTNGELAWTAALPVVDGDGTTARLVFLEASGARSLAWWQPSPLVLPALLFVAGACVVVLVLRRGGVSADDARRYDPLSLAGATLLSLLAAASVLATEGLLAPLEGVDAGTVVDRLAPASVAQDATSYLWPETTVWWLSERYGALLLMALLLPLASLWSRSWRATRAPGEVRTDALSLWPALVALVPAAWLGLEVSALQGMRFAPTLSVSWLLVAAFAIVAGAQLVERESTRLFVRTSIAVATLGGGAALLVGAL